MKGSPCVFFDRDGIINRSPGPGYVERVEDFFLMPDFPDALKVVRDKGYKAVVATNQRGISRGIMSLETVEKIHKKMGDELKKTGLGLDAVYLCPHNHNECDCRKPLPGLLLRAADEMELDLKRSWMIGDNETDIEAGRQAGCTTVLVGKTGQDSQADHRVATMTDLPEFLEKNMLFVE